MKIFVAGSTGVIGRLLLPKLVSAGHEVVGITHHKLNKESIHNSRAKAIIADVLERESILSAMKEVQPDVVIHQLTSLSKWNLSDNARIRREGTRNLVDAALEMGVKRIIAQSISWAYEPGEGFATEDVPLDVDSPMPRKMTIDGVVALERAVSEVPNHVILRYGMLYGPNTWYDHEGILAEKIRNKQVPATDGITSFLHVEDAANAALLSLDWPTGTINVVDDEPAAGTEWLPVYAEALQAPQPDLHAVCNSWDRGASNAKARKDYGWTPLYPTWRSGFVQSLHKDYS